MPVSLRFLPQILPPRLSPDVVYALSTLSNPTSEYGKRPITAQKEMWYATLRPGTVYKYQEKYNPMGAEGYWRVVGCPHKNISP